MRTLSILGILCLALALPSPALAGDPASDTRAKELYENGAQLYEEARYEDAIVAWRAAYDLSPRPLLLYNIASAEERSGQWKEAIETWNRYRAFAPSEEREVLEQRIRNLEKRVAEVEEKAAESEGPTRAPWQPEAEPEPEKIDGGEAGATSAETTEAQATAPPPPPGPHPGPFVLLGGGFVGIAAGAVLGGLALDTRGQVTEACYSDGNEILCPNTAESLLEQDQQMSLGADLAFGLGIGVAIAGGTLAIVDAVKRSEGADQLSWLPVPWLGPEGGGVALVGRLP